VHTYDGQLPRMDIKEFKTHDKKENFAKLHRMIVEHKHIDDKIKQRANELLSNMDSCENLSKFISDIVSEITMTKMTRKTSASSK
jgi:hypothetical protein